MNFNPNIRTNEDIVNDLYRYSDPKLYKECVERLHREEGAIKLTEAIIVNGNILLPVNALLEVVQENEQDEQEEDYSEDKDYKIAHI